MAAGVGVATRSDVRSAPPRYERYFFCGMVLLIAGTVFLGFAQSYFLAGVFRAPLPSWVIHVHGAAFTSWILLLIVQTSLVSARRVDIHRRLGMFGFGLACVMVVLGMMAATDLLRRDGAALGVNAKTFYAGTMADMFIFATLIYFAFRERFHPAAHKRLIFIATIMLSEAAINRWPWPIFQENPLMIYVVAYSYMLLLVAYDLWSIPQSPSRHDFGNPLCSRRATARNAHWKHICMAKFRHLGAGAGHIHSRKLKEPVNLRLNSRLVALPDIWIHLSD